MIKNMESLSMAEAQKYVDKDNSDVNGFIKKFSNIKLDKAEEMRKELEELHLIKVNSDHISKVIDLLPLNSEELKRIFVDVDLNEDETNKLLETIKKFA